MLVLIVYLAFRLPIPVDDMAVIVDSFTRNGTTTFHTYIYSLNYSFITGSSIEL